MQRIALPPVEARLRKRYLTLLEAHLRNVTKLAAGVASLPSTSSAFAATQAAWRFFNNERVTLAALVEPLRAVGRDALAGTEAPFALLVHDWCKLSFTFADSKRDLAQLTHAADIGYELATALLVGGDDGRPLAPMEAHLKTASGSPSTRRRPPRAPPPLAQVLPTMRPAGAGGLPKPLVHVIAREAVSGDLSRRWDAAGQRFLVRGDDRR